MAGIIGGIFDFLAAMFDKVPGLNKFKGYRSVLGFAGLAVTTVLKAQGIGSPELLNAFEIGFTGFTFLSLNSKGRE